MFAVFPATWFTITLLDCISRFPCYRSDEAHRGRNPQTNEYDRSIHAKVDRKCLCGETDFQWPRIDFQWPRWPWQFHRCAKYIRGYGKWVSQNQGSRSLPAPRHVCLWGCSRKKDIVTENGSAVVAAISNCPHLSGEIILGQSCFSVFTLFKLQHDQHHLEVIFFTCSKVTG